MTKTRKLNEVKWLWGPRIPSAARLAALEALADAVDEEASEYTGEKTIACLRALAEHPE